MKHYDFRDDKETNIYVVGNMLYEPMKHVNFELVWRQNFNIVLVVQMNRDEFFWVFF